MFNPGFDTTRDNTEEIGDTGDASDADAGSTEAGSTGSESSTDSSDAADATDAAETLDGDDTDTDTGEEESDAGETDEPCQFPEIPCGDVCADISSDPLHCGACEDPCAPGQDCVDHDCVSEDGRLVFLTSVALPGNELGPLSAAHQRCTELAEAAGFDGEFRAWLGVGENSPANTFTEGGPYFLVDGTIIAETTQDLFVGELLHPIDLTETGEGPTPIDSFCPDADHFAWTGIVPTGQTSPSNCGGWTTVDDNMTGIVGVPVADSVWWTYLNGCQFGCTSTELPHYCFQQ